MLPSDVRDKLDDNRNKKNFSMIIRVLVGICLACFLSLGSLLVSPSAIALTEIPLIDISYKECPPELAEGGVGSGSSDPVSCFLVTGKTKNKTGKTVYDADVFGWIYDANNEPAMQNRNRVGSIAEIEPGIHDFEVRISVPANQPTPLKLEKFKASGFTGKVRKY